jgi:hypothetical protein
MKYKLRNRLKYFIKIKRFNVFLLFLTLAFVISIAAKLSNNITQTITLELEPFNVPATDVLIDNKPKFINVTVNSQGFNLIKYAFKDLKLKVDFSEISKDSLNYLWNKDLEGYKISKLFDNSTLIQDISPKKLFFKYDLQSVKKIPVVINSKVEFSPGFNFVSSLSSKPDSIVIIGPKAIVDSIFNISTNKLEFKNLKQDINQTVELKLNRELQCSESIVQILGEVDRFTEGQFNAPVKIINTPENLNVTIFPKYVPVIFYTSLTAYNSIDKSDFVVECDFSLINQENNILFPKLVSFPESVKRASIQLSKLEYVITNKL